MNDIIYRDDDVSVHTNVYLFEKLHQEFIKRGKIHTCAVIMKDLWENQALFYYLAVTPNIEIGLHGWEHNDYSLLNYYECRNDIVKSLEYWKINAKRMFGYVKPIDTFYAPWNHESETIKQVCKELGLKFCNVKKGKWNEWRINSFHHWYLELNPQDIPKLFKN